MGTLQTLSNPPRIQRMLVVTPPLFLIATDISCWWCIEPIEVVGIIACQVATFEDGEELPCGDDPDEFFTLTYVESLPESLLAEIQTLAPAYKLSNSTTAKQIYYANTCPHCNALQGDHHVHSEPDQGFFLCDEDGVDGIRVTRLNFSERFQTEANISSSTFICNVLQRHLGLP
jgi:hypothetical protein